VLSSKIRISGQVSEGTASLEKGLKKGFQEGGFTERGGRIPRRKPYGQGSRNT